MMLPFWSPANAKFLSPALGFGGGSAPVTLPLDGYDTDLWDAWGTARLLTSYTGNLAQVRESTGSTSANIGYGASNLLDTAALASHVGAGSGYVAQLYGQKNSRHLAMATTTRQPRIRNAGTNVAFASGVALETVTADIQRMVTSGVTAYTGTNATFMAVHCSKSGAASGKIASLLDATNRSDLSDSLATIMGNGSNGVSLFKGDSLANTPGGSPTEKLRIIFGVFNGTNKILYDSNDLPGSSIQNAETTAFNFDRFGIWAYTASASWCAAGERLAAAAVWTRTLSSVEIAAITTAIETLYGIP